MRKFMVYIDDGERCFKIAVLAKSEKAAIAKSKKAAREFIKENCEVVAVKDITAEFPINLNKFEKTEIDLISQCLFANDVTN